MKVLEPHYTCRRKRNKEYCRWEIQASVSTPVKHILLEWTEWLKILEIADKYFALLDLVEQYYYEKKFNYEFLKEWMAEELRHLEKTARKYKEKGLTKEAELYEFRVKVYTEELKQREQEYKKIERIMNELGII